MYYMQESTQSQPQTPCFGHAGGVTGGVLRELAEGYWGTDGRQEHFKSPASTGLLLNGRTGGWNAWWCAGGAGRGRRMSPRKDYRASNIFLVKLTNQALFILLIHVDGAATPDHCRIRVVDPPGAHRLHPSRVGPEGWAPVLRFRMDREP